MRLLTFITIILLSTISFAQVNSVESRNGAGTLIYGTTARSMTSGDLGTANYDDDRINVFNPASYGSFVLTRVDFGQVLEASFVSSSGKKSYYGGSYFPGFNIGFPISQAHGVGLVFGVNKYSDVSYEGSRDGSLSGAGSYVPTSYKEEYYYDGGLTKIFLGSSYRLPFGWNIGASGDFYMGHYEYQADLKFFTSSVLDGNFAKEQNFKGFGATFGLISNNLNEYFNIQGIEEFRISAGYSLKTKLKGEYATYSVNNFGIHDTASLGDAESTVPSRFFAGFSLKFNHRTKIFGDFVSQSWSDYYSTNTSAQSLTNTFKASLGLEYVPQTKASTFEPDLSYRLGVSYEKLPYLILGEPSYRMSAGAGISIPLSPANYVDLGVLYSFNTTAATNAVKDHTISFVVGLSIGELWFLRTDY